MHIDTVGFLGLDPCAVCITGLKEPRIGLLILRGAENTGHIVLHHLQHGGGVYNHKVNVVRTSSRAITASIVMGRRFMDVMKALAEDRFTYPDSKK